MKIANVQTYVLRTTLGDRAFGWSQRVGNSRQTAICSITTDEGLHGLGEALYPDLCATGGFTEMAQIVALASTANIPVVPHVWGTNIGLAASLQAFAALPHFPDRRFPAEPWFEYDRSANPLREGTTLEAVDLQDRYLAIPNRPGIGVTLDVDFIQSHLDKL
jgi:D-galactarolactone cycloisomerase